MTVLFIVEDVNRVDLLLMKMVLYLLMWLGWEGCSQWYRGRGRWEWNRLGSLCCQWTCKRWSLGCRWLHLAVAFHCLVMSPCGCAAGFSRDSFIASHFPATSGTCWTLFLLLLQHSVNFHSFSIATSCRKLSSRLFSGILCWLPSHAGIPANEQADKIAKTALTKYISKISVPWIDLLPSVTTTTTTTTPI